MLDNNLNVYRNNSEFNNGSAANILECLYDFLKEAELQQYFEDLNIKLKVRSIAQLKYVDETDLQAIGMSRPEMRRLKKYFAKECPQTTMGKLKKRLSRTTSCRSTSVPRPEDLSNRMNSYSVRVSTNGQSISPMDSDDLTTIASVTNFSIASNGTSDSYDWRQLGSKHLVSQTQLTLGPILRHGELTDIYKGNFRSGPSLIPVAVKVINKVVLKGDVNDFVREIFTNCYLEHANVAKLYGICLDDYSIKMVTELAQIGSLADCLPVPESKVRYPITVLHVFVTQISDAMSFLEERRVVHGRLIERNVLLFPNNQAKVTDAGLFRAQTSLDKNDISDGNLWLAPELVRGHKETIHSDVWAFGVLLWEIFSYCRHSPASQIEESMSSQVDMSLPYLSQPDLCPNMVFQVMQLCWTESPKDRPSFYQLSSQLIRLEPEQVVALTDGPDSIPSHRSDEANEPSDGSYSSLTEMQMLYYKMDDTIIVLDRSMNQYKELWRGCLLTGESGYFKWLNMRAMAVIDVPQTAKSKCDQASPAPSVRSNGRSIGEAFSKIRISRKEEKKKQTKLSADMISGPKDDFRHVGHVGPNGDVFGDVTSLYTSSAQKKSKHGESSVAAKSDFGANLSEVGSIISSTTLNAAGEDTPPYATIDSEPNTIRSNRSKEGSHKPALKEKKVTLTGHPAPPLPPVRCHSEEESNPNVYIDELTINNEFAICDDSFSLFEELSKHWEMQSSKLETPTSESATEITTTMASLREKSPTPIDGYSEVYDEQPRSNSTYLPVNIIIESPKSENIPDQRSMSFVQSSTSNGSNTSKSNIFQKFRVFGSSKSKSKDHVDDPSGPVYAKLNKPSKSKNKKEASEKKKNIISKPILISAPVAASNEFIDDNYLDCSSEVSSLQPSPRDSVLCLANIGPNTGGSVDPSPSFSRQQSANACNGNNRKTSDSTTTTVSPASSYASLTSAPQNNNTNALQGGSALRALRKGDCVFRATSAVNALNRKRPSVGQIQLEQYPNEYTMSRTRQPSLPLTSCAMKMPMSTIDRRNPLPTTNDNYEQLDGLMDSSATTPMASDLPELPYIELSFVRNTTVPEKVTTCEEEDAYNSLHSGSLGSDTIERRGYQRPSDPAPNPSLSHPPGNNDSDHAPSEGDHSAPFKSGSKSKYSYNFAMNRDDDEVAL